MRVATRVITQSGTQIQELCEHSESPVQQVTPLGSHTTGFYNEFSDLDYLVHLQNDSADLALLAMEMRLREKPEHELEVIARPRSLVPTILLKYKPLNRGVLVSFAASDSPLTVPRQESTTLLYYYGHITPASCKGGDYGSTA